MADACASALSQCSRVMARKSRNTQEQLVLPEIELFAVEQVRLSQGEASAQVDSLPLIDPLAGAATEADEATVKPKAVRRRPAKPRVVPLREGLATAEAAADIPPAMALHDANETGLRQSLATPRSAEEAALLPPVIEAALARIEEGSDPAGHPLQKMELAPAMTEAGATNIPPLSPSRPAAVAAPAVREATPAKPEESGRVSGALSQRNPGEVAMAHDTAPLRLWAHLAAIGASLAAVLVLSLGAYQFTQTQEAQREVIAAQKEALRQERSAKAVELNAKAVELFLKYNELMLQLNAPQPRNAKKENRYWKESLAINLLSSLYNLTRGDREWETTIAWALERHSRFVREQRLACGGYSDEFVRYLEKSLGGKPGSFCRE